MVCGECAAGTTWDAATYACKECIGTLSDDKTTCTPCADGVYKPKKLPEWFDSTDKTCKTCDENSGISKDKLTCTPCLAGTEIWMDSIDFDCKICAGINNEGCKLCYEFHHVFDQATKTCINNSVPGTVSVNTSGWTKTTYPVETFTPCDASKNESA